MSGEGVGSLQDSAGESRQLLVVDHPGRPAYRRLAVVIGLLFVGFGVAALVIAGDVPFAGKAGHGLLGLVANRATGVLWLLLGLLVVLGAALPDNAGAYTLTGAAGLIVLVGLIFLAVSRTDANVVAYSVMDVCVTWVAGMAVLWCGMHTFVLGADFMPLGRRDVARSAAGAPPES